MKNLKLKISKDHKGLTLFRKQMTNNNAKSWQIRFIKKTKDTRIKSDYSKNSNCRMNSIKWSIRICPRSCRLSSKKIKMKRKVSKVITSIWLIRTMNLLMNAKNSSRKMKLGYQIYSRILANSIRLDRMFRLWK